MNRTKIEWCDYTINPVKGLCPMVCDYCYARAMYKRFKWNPEIRLDRHSFLIDDMPNKPSKIFVGSTIELFHPETICFMPFIMEQVEFFKRHTFIFLTKQPQNLLKWSPFPDNCWVGVSFEGAGIAKENSKRYGFTLIHSYMKEIEAAVKFISIEPMLRACTPILSGLDIFDWVIIGGLTPCIQKMAPRLAWVKEVTDTAKVLNIPVFHKDNLGWMFDADGFPKRQEFPRQISYQKNEG